MNFHLSSPAELLKTLPRSLQANQFDEIGHFLKTIFQSIGLLNDSCDVFCDWRMNMFQCGSGDETGLSRKLRHGAASQS